MKFFGSWFPSVAIMGASFLVGHRRFLCALRHIGLSGFFGIDAPTADFFNRDIGLRPRRYRLIGEFLIAIKDRAIGGVLLS
jgi:hypothetical protein